MFGEFTEKKEDENGDDKLPAVDGEKQKQLILSYWADFYDQKYPDRAKDDNYERIKNEWIAEKYEETIESEEYNVFREKKILSDQKKYEDALIDDVTGFRIRKELFKKMDEDVKGLFGFDKDAQLSSEEWIDVIEAEKNNFENINLSVMMSDISYLSLANEGGHINGDKLLMHISEKIREHNINGFRHGGDEITALFYEPREVFKKKIQALSEEIRSQKNVANLADYNLVPNLDIGVAHFSEGLRAFRELLKNKEGRDRIKREKTLDELKNIWLEIADKRAFLEKGRVRIALLMDRFSEDREGYNEVINFLRKGGYNIRDDELEQLIADTRGSEKGRQTEIVKNFIMQKEKQALLKLSSYKRLKAEIICNIVGIK